MNKLTENGMVYDKHGRITGVNVYNTGGRADVRKLKNLPHRPGIRILFVPDHKKVCDLPSLLYIKRVSNCAVDRLKGTISAYMQGLIVQSGADSLKLQAC